MISAGDIQQPFTANYKVISTGSGHRFVNKEGTKTPCIISYLDFMDAPFKLIIYIEGNITVALEKDLLTDDNYHQFMLNKFMEMTGRLHLSTFTSNTKGVKDITIERVLTETIRDFSRHYFKIILNLNNNTQHIIKFNESDRAEFTAETLTHVALYPLQLSHPILVVPNKKPEFIIAENSTKNMAIIIRETLAKYGASEGWNNTKNVITYPKTIDRVTFEELNTKIVQMGIAKVTKTNKSLIVKFEFNANKEILLRYQKNSSVAEYDNLKYEWDSDIQYHIAYYNINKKLIYTNFSRAAVMKDVDLMKDIISIVSMLRVKTTFFD